MIQINLLRNRVDRGAATDFDIPNLNTYSGDGRASIGSILGKLLIIFSFTGVLAYLQTERMAEITQALTALQSEVVTLQQSVEQQKKFAGNAIEFQKQAQVLENKLNVLKQLSRLRLREIKALDYLQNVIPEKVWLTAIVYQNDKVKIKGFAMNETDLATFVQRIDNPQFFSNVILVQTTDVRSKIGFMKSFEISSEPEVIN